MFAGAPFLPVGPQKRKREHGEKNGEQAECGFGDRALALGQNGKPTVDKFDVNPIDEQRSFAELDEWAKAGLCETPTAPSVGNKQNDKKKAAAHEEKIGIGVPVIVDGVEVEGRFVENLGESAGGDANKTDESESESFPALRKVRVERKTYGEASEGESRPREERKEPGLGLGEDVDAIDVRLELPGKKTRTMRRPERRRNHGDEGCGSEAGGDRAIARGGGRFGRREKAEDAHEDHGEAENVKDVNAEQVSPGSIAESERVFLNAEEES